MTRITSDELEKIRLRFLGCENCEVASLMESVIRTLEKKNAKLSKRQTRLKNGFCPFVINVTLCHLTRTHHGVFYFILIFLPLGDWTFIVNGRKRSYVLHAKLQEEATRWANAIQEVNLKTCFYYKQ